MSGIAPTNVLILTCGKGMVQQTTGSWRGTVLPVLFIPLGFI